MAEYKVCYSLNDEQVAQLDRITELYNNITCATGGDKIAPERLFENLMFIGSAPEITSKLSFFEQNFTANQPQNKTA